MITGMLKNSGWQANHSRTFHGLQANHCRATDALLNGEVFYTLHEAQILIERWR